MTREGHVRFCEGLRGKFPRLLDCFAEGRLSELHIPRTNLEFLEGHLIEP